MTSPKTGVTPSAQNTIHIVPAPGQPSVLAIAEMNLEEFPAFRLGRRSKRHDLRYTRTRSEPDGRTLEQVWIVRGVEGLGLPGPFEQDLYVALLVLFTEQGLPADGRIRFTRNRLAQVMGCSNSGRGYELLEQGLSRLAGASIHTEHAFYRLGAVGPGGERTGPAERLSLDFHILEEVRVYERRTLVEDTLDFPTPEAARPRVEQARPLELSLARLGQPLVQSYERRYTKGLDATFYFSLERPLAKRLYRYLDKVRNGRGSFEIGLLALADVLGLEYRYPSDVKDGLDDAHAELQTTGYLATAAYTPMAGGRGPLKAGGAGDKVVYGIHPLFDRRPRRRAGAAGVAGTLIQGAASALGHGLPEPALVESASLEPASLEPPAPEPAVDSPPAPAGDALQVELESFGITPARAAALVAAHPAADIAARMAYVRELLRRPGASPLKNPAGFLARAIEEAYAVPKPRPAPQPAPAPLPEPLCSPVEPLAREPLPKERQGKGAKASAPPREPEPPGTEAVPDESPWGRLAAALKIRLSAATYAAWVAPAEPATPGISAGPAGATLAANPDKGGPVAPAPPEAGAVETNESVAGQGAGAPATLTVILPSAFALDRWRRPPLSTALQEAAPALNLSVILEQAATPQDKP